MDKKKWFDALRRLMIALVAVTALSGATTGCSERPNSLPEIHSVRRDREGDIRPSGFVAQADSVARATGIKAWGVARWVTFIVICLLSVAVSLIPGAFAEGAVALGLGLVLLYFANRFFSGWSLAVMLAGPVLCYIIPGVSAMRGTAGATRVDDFVFGAARFAGILLAFGLVCFLHWLA
ncbi:hypothetical protein KJ951_02580 [Patescibacteria group bacterium]|nr:hypothetical protein [Patescibacteria group bacterium]MBU1703266.1 hypothetical protein [Patescibacteria group bacterium]MBU1954240.1 hypothetical protein [Patescibacteria group bacterium]